MFFQNYDNIITDIIIPQNVHIPGNVIYCDYMPNLINSLIVSKDITEMFETYYGCYNLVRSACGPNVVSMRNTYQRCYNLTEAVCGPNVVSMGSTYQGCESLKDAVCGPNVTSMPTTYSECYNLVNAACGPNVKIMSGTYYNCYNLKKAACGPNVTNMYYTYQGCENLKKAVCGSSVINMDGTYYECYNLTDAACGPNVDYMGGTYYRCLNLINAACGSNVTNMITTYSQCYNLKNAVCGPNVTYMYYTYYGCENLINAACGPNVLYMENTYEYCSNLINAVCGPKVDVMYGTYNGCSNLKNSACGSNVTLMYYTYSYCGNLINATCGPNVVNMTGAYYQCYNLKDAICGNNVTKMYYTYYYCSNLKNAEIGANVSNLVYAFYGCSNLQTLKVKSYYPPYIRNYTTFYMVPNSMTVKVPMSSVSTYQSTSYWNNFQIVPDMEIHIYELENDISIAENKSKEINIQYHVDYDYDDINIDENMIVNVVSSDETSLTISNVYFENNYIYFTATTGELERLVPVLISVSIGDVSKTAEINIKTGYSPSTYTASNVSGASYGFVSNGDYYESNNKNAHGTAALCKVEIESNGEDRLYIDCIQTSESNYDYGLISKLDQTLSNNYSHDSDVFASLQGLYTTSNHTIDYGIIPEGSHFIYIKYRKDGSASQGNDSLKFKLRFEREGG